ncbi:DUF3426 domain-containing protein [Pusillimonas sp. ANT_WB101]|uniref:DUF3426 domain-containing protein n=1 Tax=Pusillimonas sp. ANT_WB101 TaxID=2597356 RepID=UPI0011EC47F1|nr:DUF3426 domain-containing protein [Pusillimonas sp. ANT_WB101]
MDLTTRCPHCGTTFPASLEQLLLRKGYIRCINCANIFDGYEAVVSGDPAAHPATPPSKPAPPLHPPVSEPPASAASEAITAPDSSSQLPSKASVFTDTQRETAPSEVTPSPAPPDATPVPMELQREAALPEVSPSAPPQYVASVSASSRRETPVSQTISSSPTHDVVQVPAVPQRAASVSEDLSDSNLLQRTVKEQSRSGPATHQISAQAAPAVSTPSHIISESGSATATAGAGRGPSFIISDVSSQDAPGSNVGGADDSEFSIGAIVRRRSEQRVSASEPESGQRTMATATYDVTGVESGARQEPVLGEHTLPARATQQPHFVASPKPDTVVPSPVAASVPSARMREPVVDVREPRIAGAELRHTSERPEPALPIRSRETLATSAKSDGVYIEPRSVRVESQDFAADTHERSSMGSMLARAAWRVLTVLGVAVLLAQLVYVYRVQIANQVPLVRPMLETACASLACDVPYSREISAISIMNSALRAETASTSGKTEQSVGSPNIMVLSVTLRNDYAKPQEWPTLALGLTDFSGTLVVRRNLPPEAYLPANIASQPFPAGSEITARVPIVLNDNKVNGYQLDKFFQ